LIAFLQDNFSRRILYRLGVGRGSSSYPLLSGDTFRGLCDYEIPANFEFFFSALQENCKEFSVSFFLNASLGSSFAMFLKSRVDLDFSRSYLVMHNYDNIPSEFEFGYLASRFKRIHSVNWLGSNKIANPVPIGLENWSYWRNGVPSDFRKYEASTIPSSGCPPYQPLMCVFCKYQLC
jgi:hypothetical protein